MQFRNICLYNPKYTYLLVTIAVLYVYFYISTYIEIRNTQNIADTLDFISKESILKKTYNNPISSRHQNGHRY